MGKNIKTKKNNTRKYKSKRQQSKRKQTKRKRGGKYRKQEVHANFGRQHTNPDIKGVVRILSGPTTHTSEGYVSNFVAQSAKEVEEQFAVMLYGVPSSRTKKKVIMFEYNDNDAPLEQGSTKSVQQCKKPSQSKIEKDKK